MRTERTIRNCPVRMKAQCPKTWDGLLPTDRSNVRHCTRCDSDVFLCATDAETLEHARAGRCIARDEPHASELPRVTLDGPAVEPTPAQRVAREFRSRERGITTLLNGRLQGASRDCPECGFPVPGFRNTCYVCRFEVGRAWDSEG